VLVRTLLLLFGEVLWFTIHRRPEEHEVMFCPEL
jgi:hypothetical protein